jgi:hypothetical protein
MTEEALYPLQREALSEDSIFLLAGTRRLKDSGMQREKCTTVIFFLSSQTF